MMKLAPLIQSAELNGHVQLLGSIQKPALAARCVFRHAPLMPSLAHLSKCTPCFLSGVLAVTYALPPVQWIAFTC